MALEYFRPGTLNGPKGDDDYIRKVFNIGDTTDHAVQTAVLNDYGVKSEFRYDLDFVDIDQGAIPEETSSHRYPPQRHARRPYRRSYARCHW